MPAQIRIAKNGGVSIARGCPLRGERAGEKCVQPGLAHRDIVSGHSLDKPGAREAGQIGKIGECLGLV